jgi:Zn-dependent protease with chaperone function
VTEKQLAAKSLLRWHEGVCKLGIFSGDCSVLFAAQIIVIFSGASMPETRREEIMSQNPTATSSASAKLGPYRYEKTLFAIVAVIAAVTWVLVTVGTLGIVWIYMVFLYAFFLVVHSALISHVKGNTVRIDESQFPELHARVRECADKVGLDKLPEVYLMSGNGLLNAFATRFLRRYYVVLLSDIVDALASDPEGINFYIGHEMGHIARKHVAHHWWTGPVLFLPLLGTAYRRAQEYTCDQYGAACCNNLESASRALAVLAAGVERWKQLDAQAFIKQTSATSGFWMSLNELTSEYPWLCKRMARLHNPEVKTPRRHPLAWLLATFMPSAGPGGLVVSMFLLVIMLGVLAALAIPAYQDYKHRAAYPAAFSYAETLSAAVLAQIEAEQEVPSDAAALGLPPGPENVTSTTIDPDSGQITLMLKNDMVIVEELLPDEKENLAWNCTTTIPAKAIPANTKCASVEGVGGGLESLGKLFNN